MALFKPLLLAYNEEYCTCLALELIFCDISKQMSSYSSFSLLVAHIELADQNFYVFT